MIICVIQYNIFFYVSTVSNDMFDKGAISQLSISVRVFSILLFVFLILYWHSFSWCISASKFSIASLFASYSSRFAQRDTRLFSTRWIVFLFLSISRFRSAIVEETLCLLFWIFWRITSDVSCSFWQANGSWNHDNSYDYYQIQEMWRLYSQIQQATNDGNCVHSLVQN